ncbi:hypothetical protein ASE11_22700 [Hydrogenophaga sp. Root209]|nr:hypothetical protein ASE11_22700 [Hydrogenophaga sp. Root209]
MGFTVGEALNAINPFSFTGGAYLNQATGEIVVAYKGTDFLVEFEGRAWNTVADLLTDVGLASTKALVLGLGQQLNAMAYYLAVKDWAVDNGHDPAKISFTGHSLGGGLAANMAVWFDRPATTFASAPFEINTLNPIAIGAAFVAITSQFAGTALAGLFDGTGFEGSVAVVDSANDLGRLLFNEIVAENLYENEIDQTEFDRRELAVTNLYNEGEFLWYGRELISTVIGTDINIDLGDGSQPLEYALGLHSMNLHAAFLFEDRLRQLIKQIPELLGTLLNKNLYAADPNTATQDFITRLVNDQLRQGFGQPSALSRFTEDVDKLKSTEGTVAQEDMRKALIALAMDFHFHAPEGNTGTLFQLESGAIHFNLSDINSDFLKGLPLLRDAASSTAIGSDPFETDGLREADSWHIQTGGGVMNWQANALANDAAIGGSGADVFRAGGGRDVLVGGNGDDLLEGGGDSDVLLGGSGNDTYTFASGHGHDVILDADGQGRLVFAGQTIAVGKRMSEDSEAWEDTTGHYRITRIDEHTLRLGTKSGQDSITLKSWNDGELGLVLGEEVQEHEPPVPATLYLGDQRALEMGIEVRQDEIDAAHPFYGYYAWSLTSWLPDGTLQGGVQEEDFADVISASMQNEGVRMLGFGGNDALTGGRGDDYIDGGDGGDLLSGGEGSDHIVGGAGNDMIFSGASLYVLQRRESDDEYVVPVGTLVLASGPTWARYTDAQGNWLTPDGWMSNTGVGLAVGDYVDAGDGDDTVVGSHAADVLLGGSGDDLMRGAGGDDHLMGGAGGDWLEGDGPIHEVLVDGGGFIGWTAEALHGNDLLEGGDGDDEIRGGGGSDQLFGGLGDDWMYGDASGNWAYVVQGQWHGQDLLVGGLGNDKLAGGGDDDLLIGGEGDDELWGDEGPHGPDDLLFDPIYHGNDTLYGGVGDDFLHGGGGNDWLDGGDGNDYLQGGDGNDSLDGGAGADVLFGEAGDDFLDGGEGDDILVGGEGADVLVGGRSGYDYLIGGLGDDEYLILSPSAGGTTAVQDGKGNDVLRLSIDLQETEILGRDADMILKFAGHEVILMGALRGGSIDAVEFRSGERISLPVLAASIASPLVVQGIEGARMATLLGGGADDTMVVAATQTSVRAGRGDDRIEMPHDETLLFMQRGDGQDELVLDDSRNHLLFLGAGISPEDVRLHVSSLGSVRLLLGGGVDGGDSLLLPLGVDDLAGSRWLQEIIFADGGSLTWTDVLAKGLSMDGGGSGSDVLRGSPGDDTVWLRSGQGMDRLEDEQGALRLVMSPEFSLSEMRVSSPLGSTDLQLAWMDEQGEADGVLIVNGLRGAAAITLETRDGQTLDLPALLQRLEGGGVTREAIVAGGELHGSRYADQLYGGVGDDVLIGSGGDDRLKGGGGYDTYHFDLGDGFDRIEDPDPLLDLTFGPGVALDDLRIRRVEHEGAEGLEVAYSDTDLVWINTENGMPTGDVKLEGHPWMTFDQLLGIALSEDRVNIGSGSDDVLRGWAGDDVLDGQGGLDELRGGRGHDVYVLPVEGRALVVDTDGGANTVLVGTRFANRVEMHRRGADLVLRDLDTEGLMSVEGFFTNLSQSWVLQLDGGATLDLRRWAASRLQVDASDASLREQHLSAALPFLLAEPYEVFTDESASGDIYTNESLWNRINVQADGTPLLVDPSDYDTSVYSSEVLSEAWVEGIQSVYQGSQTVVVEPERIRYLGPLDLYRMQLTGSYQLPPGAFTLFLEDGYHIYQHIAAVTRVEYFYEDVSYAYWQATYHHVWREEKPVLDVLGTSGDDRIVVEASRWFESSNTSAMTGGEGADWLQRKIDRTDSTYGGAYTGDLMLGGAGSDILLGGFYADQLLGGYGADWLSGDSGDDTYYIASSDDGVDIVFDLEAYLYDAYQYQPNGDEGYGTSEWYLDEKARGLDRGEGYRDTIAFGVGIDASALHVERTRLSLPTWLIENTLLQIEPSMDVSGWDEVDALRISWVGADGVDVGSVVVADDELLAAAVGFGIERYTFADGRTLSRAQILDMISAPAALYGTNGADRLTGNTRGNVYVVNDAGDRVVEAVDAGVDVVHSSVDHTLGNNVENLILTGMSALRGTGNSLDNRIGGNDLDNRLDGRGGADWLEGGLGDDVYLVDDVGDIVVESFIAGGTDTVHSRVDYALPDSIERVYLQGTETIHARGNELDNVLYGHANSAANTLDGGLGDDAYHVGTGDTVVEGVDGGTDRVITVVNYVLDRNVENLSGNVDTGLQLSGNELNNTITGHLGDDTLHGEAGDDTLNGKSGADVMAGGVGEDRYFVDNAGDVVIEQAGEGTTDIVYSTVSYNLGSNVERIYLQGAEAINAGGNELDNILYGHVNAAVNVMSGGLGNDTYYVGAGDVVMEAADAGTDRVITNANHTLRSHVENLKGNADTGLYLSGNELNNVITGDIGDDTLDGGAGKDTLAGGAGNDTYVLGFAYGADVIKEDDATSGNTDLLRFLDGVSTEQIWFRQVSNNLEVSIIGTSDKATISNWYTGNQYKVEQFQTADNQTLLSTQVDSLVQAMAAFSPPPPGQTTLTPAQQSALSPVIAANWN